MIMMQRLSSRNPRRASLFSSTNYEFGSWWYFSFWTCLHKTSAFDAHCPVSASRIEYGTGKKITESEL